MAIPVARRDKFAALVVVTKARVARQDLPALEWPVSAMAAQTPMVARTLVAVAPAAQPGMCAVSIATVKVRADLLVSFALAPLAKSTQETATPVRVVLLRRQPTAHNVHHPISIAPMPNVQRLGS